MAFLPKIQRKLENQIKIFKSKENLFIKRMCIYVFTG